MDWRATPLWKLIDLERPPKTFGWYCDWFAAMKGNGCDMSRLPRSSGEFRALIEQMKGARVLVEVGEELRTVRLPKPREPIKKIESVKQEKPKQQTLFG